jgi:hypothetical protein
VKSRSCLSLSTFQRVKYAENAVLHNPTCRSFGLKSVVVVDVGLVGFKAAGLYQRLGGTYCLHLQHWSGINFYGMLYFNIT